MHELAIAQSIAEAVAARAAEHRATRVTRVRLRIGEASGIVTDSLTACFEMLAALDPLLEGARLVIEATPHRARCHRCATDFSVVSYVARCPTCGEWSGDIISGTELQILDIEIETQQKPV